MSSPTSGSRPLRKTAFGYLTGWRIGEILPLRWKQVDFDAGVIRLDVGTTKNRDARVLPFHVLPPLADLLRRQRERTDRKEREHRRIIPWVFHRRGNEIKTIKRAWEKACRAAGCEGRLFHDFRRTAVRNLERAGVPRSIAMKISGHKTEAVYRRYAIVNERDVAEGSAGWRPICRDLLGDRDQSRPMSVETRAAAHPSLREHFASRRSAHTTR